MSYEYWVLDIEDLQKFNREFLKNMFLNVFKNHHPQNFTPNLSPNSFRLSTTGSISGRPETRRSARKLRS